MPGARSKPISGDLLILAFASAAQLRAWLTDHYAASNGIWLRIFKKNSGIASVAFEEVLDEGLCFGWSESARRAHDSAFYLQRFTPRRAVGTQSRRNLERAQVLIQTGRMTLAGLKALGLDKRAGFDHGR